MRYSNGSSASAVRKPSTSRITGGATSSIACSRWWWVATTASASNRSRTDRAISSRPVLSTNFLGPLRLVARAPAEVGPALDLLLQPQDPVQQRLGPRRAARDIDVHGHE